MAPRIESPIIARVLGERLSAEPGVVCAYLFGSHSRGEARVGSDIDLAVLMVEPVAEGLLNPLALLQMDLEDATGCTVDLIDLHKVGADLIHRVLRDGIVVFESDASRRIAFEVDARNRYFDLLPYLEEYRQAGNA
ncbi:MULTISPECIES: nucleotidyltransferase family protein [unclassified Thioalkalivibrio]|uniref:type VII toxin-antitoxin system MntA family adenylyltransferase antitoxin n=1 Tax=unclassified Thioalkalivibrio TaxID=2621013 RepID=UPI00037733AB|nr:MULTISPECIES: nucleotidyltransferase domain-containing protein [unclassified Thioalkalivibrio]